MRAACRHTTVVLLAASYLLATVGTWLHHSHDCPEADGIGQLAGSSCLCDGHRHNNAAGQGRGQLAEPSLIVSSSGRVEHLHDPDGCLLCRFSCIQKSVAFQPDLAIYEYQLPSSVALVLPAWRVAERLATPECRAPPRMA